MYDLPGSKPTLKGRAIVLPSYVHAGLIVPISCRGSYNRDAFRDSCFEYLDPSIRTRVAHGDIIVAGRNFARGETGEETTMALMGMGIGAVIAESVNRMFLRNAVNLGFPVVIFPDALKMIDDFDVVTVDPIDAIVMNKTKGLAGRGKILPHVFIKILEAGGIVNYVNLSAAKSGSGKTEKKQQGEHHGD